MIQQTGRFLTPVVVIAIAFVLAFFDSFSSPIVTVVSLLTTVVAALYWRRFVFNNLSPDYQVLFETATGPVRLSAIRWSATIFVSTYFILLLSCGLGYFLAGSWITFALIALLVGQISKIPLSAIATDWVLHRIEIVPGNV